MPIEHYRAMADFSWSIAFPASVWGVDKAVAGVSYDSHSVDQVRYAPSSSAVSVSGPLSLSGPSRTTRGASQSRMHSTPCTHLFLLLTQFLLILQSVLDQKSKGNSKQEHRNKFYEVVSPIMPQSIRAWAQAARAVGEDFNQDQPAREGVNRGYVLPEPALFANHQDDKACQCYLGTYLKLRDILLYQLKKHGSLAVLRSPAEWRMLLGLELHGKRSDTKTAASRRNALKGMAAGGQALVCYL